MKKPTFCVAYVRKTKFDAKISLFTRLFFCIFYTRHKKYQDFMKRLYKHIKYEVVPPKKISEFFWRFEFWNFKYRVHMHPSFEVDFTKETLYTCCVARDIAYIVLSETSEKWVMCFLIEWIPLFTPCLWFFDRSHPHLFFVPYFSMYL